MNRDVGERSGCAENEADGLQTKSNGRSKVEIDATIFSSSKELTPEFELHRNGTSSSSLYLDYAVPVMEEDASPKPYSETNQRNNRIAGIWKMPKAYISGKILKKATKDTFRDLSHSVIKLGRKIPEKLAF